MAKSKTKFKIEIIVIELLLICALLGVLFIKKVESYHFESDATYFSDSVAFSVPKGSVAKVNDKTKEIRITRQNDYDLPASGIPVYFNDQRKVVLMKDSAILRPSNGNVISNRLSYFTEISTDSNGLISIKRDTNEGIEMGGIIFDGENSYFLLEDGYLEIGNRRISVSAYSYAYVLKDNYIEYYDYSTGEVTIEGIDGISVYLRDINDSYRINLCTDIVSFNSSDVMLSGYIDSYKPYFEANEE